MKSGGASYDVIVPSDYMVGKMIAENITLKGLLQTLDERRLSRAGSSGHSDNGNFHTVSF